MELKTEALYMEEKKGPAITQVTFDETYHLPDYLPDFFSVILSRGDVRLDESKWKRTYHGARCAAVSGIVPHRTGGMENQQSGRGISVSGDTDAGGSGRI